ncbi:hypothetical protein GNI_182630 [Gregarina niphandrodes]|uniref:Transmembrane protein n=1 Tax=Gregarina niphandrodes TaxID=110365 RepID=A0A023AXJ6_GRENI|nr:hypothetical protein GNI_182630 [Gregarina niphandrodes]EZG43203.1 hypothetical protein GNI_182630 [Gregarina niphandrodes]|eukprot:XP_011133534.1 hypothetical protein GNI_182630 [Gregarina niphandrodes]
MRGCCVRGVQSLGLWLAWTLLDCIPECCASLDGASLNGASVNGEMAREESCGVAPMRWHYRLELGPERGMSLRLFLAVALQCLDQVVGRHMWLVSPDQIQFRENTARVWVRLHDDRRYWKRPDAGDEDVLEECRLIAMQSALLELAQMGGVNQTAGFWAAPDYQQEDFVEWLTGATTFPELYLALVHSFVEQLAPANYRTDNASWQRLNDADVRARAYRYQHWHGVCRPMLERHGAKVGVARVHPALYVCERCVPRLLNSLAMPGSLTSGWAPPGSWVVDAWRKETEFAAAGVRQQAMDAAVGVAKLPWAATWNATWEYWRDAPNVETRVCNAVDERIRLHTVVSLRNLVANYRLTRPLVDSLQRDARSYCKRAARIAHSRGIRPNTGWFVGCYDQAYVTLELGVPNHRLTDCFRGRPRPVKIKSKLRLLLTPDCLKAPTEEDAEKREAAFFRKVRYDAGCHEQILFQEEVHTVRC